MMQPPLLFSTRPFEQLIATTDAAVRRQIEQLSRAGIDNDTASAIYAANSIALVSVQTADARQGYPEETRIDVADETAPGGRRLVDGRRFSFRIPFTGEKEMLRVCPSNFAGPLPYGEVKETYISFQLEQPADGAIEDILSTFELNRSQLAGCATALGQQVEAYNASLQQYITNKVAARKARLDKDLADAQSLQVPFIS